MPHLTVNAMKRSEERSELTIDARVGSQTAHLSIRSLTPGIALEGSGNVALGALLALAAGRGERLDLGGLRLSPKLRAGADAIQAVYRDWRFARRPIEITGYEASPDLAPAGPRQRACFFTGGADSFDTLLRHRDRIDTLLYVYGLDIPLERTDLIESTHLRLAETADHFGLSLVELETDIRPLYERHRVGWLPAFFPIMGAMAHSLSGRFEHVYHAGIGDYASVRNSPESPLLRGLMDSETVSMELTGIDSSRIEKLTKVCESEFVRATLKCCNRSAGNFAVNCNSCEKCLRTRLALLAIGRLEEVLTFDSGLDLASVRAIDIKPLTRHFYVEIVEELARTGRDPDARAAIEYALAGGPPRLRAKRFVKQSRPYQLARNSAVRMLR